MWPRVFGRLLLWFSHHPSREQIVAVYRRHYLFDMTVKVDPLIASNVLVHLPRCAECAYETLNV